MQLVFRNPQHKGCDQKARQVGVLAGGGQLVITRARIVFADRGARFHRVGDQAVVDQFQRGDMGRRFDGRIHLGAVVFDPAPVKALVVGDLVMHAVRAVSQSLRHVDDGGQFFEFRCVGHGLGRIFRFHIGLGDHGCIGVAHMAHFAMGQNGALGFFHGRAIARADEPTCGVAAHIFKVFAGEHGQNAGHPRRRRSADRFDARVRHV